MVHLRVLAGPSPTSLSPIPANSDQWTPLVTPSFEGRIAVQIKGYVGPGNERPESKYFEREDRRGKTWSVAFQGRFLQDISADDLLFGNTFDRPILLPWGSSAVLSFMSLVDPTLSHNLSAQKPWAVSPLISSFPYLKHQTGTQLPDDAGHPSEVLGEGGWELPRSGSGSGGVPGSFGGSGWSSGASSVATSGTNTPRRGLDTPAERRSYFQSAANRQSVTFGPNDILTGDFCHSFLTFPSLSLSLPGGFSFDLKRYWDGQPVRFVCVRRARGEGKEPWEGEVFWCVQMEIVEGVGEVRHQAEVGEDEKEQDGEGEEDEDEDEEDEEFEDAEDGEDEKAGVKGEDVD